MNTTFLLNGGAGRVVAAIPALQKFAKKNPNDDFKVIVQGWSEIYQNHPLLHQKTFNFMDRGIFEFIVKDSNLVYPEPYFLRSYYTQNTHMVDAFDEIINNEQDTRNSLVDTDEWEPYLFVSKLEENQIRGMLSQIKEETKREQIVVFQPYGSGIKVDENKRPFDPSYRSLDVDDALEVIKVLSESYTVIYFGPDEFRHPGDNYSVNLSKIANKNLRFYMNMIRECDYFIGVDSVGNHMANAFLKKSTLVLGSTFAMNVAYKNSTVILPEVRPVYSPLRICENSYTDEINSRCMDYDHDTLEAIARSPDSNMD